MVEGIRWAVKGDVKILQVKTNKRWHDVRSVILPVGDPPTLFYDGNGVFLKPTKKEARRKKR